MTSAKRPQYHSRAGERSSPTIKKFSRIGNLMKNTLITAACLAAFIAPAFAAQSQITAKLEPQSIALGESAQLTVTSNGSAQTDVPQVNGLEIEQIGQESSIQMIN